MIKDAWWKQLGPGLLFAGAAIGVSHLVQSTRAGATYGFELLWVIPLIHVVKYPFFEFGTRYVAATGENLIEGYRRLGRWAVVLFLLFSLLTIFTIQATVTLVTAGIFLHLTGWDLPAWQMSGIILLLLASWLVAERFSWLEKGMKVIILLLTISTILAVVMASSSGTVVAADNTFQWDTVGIAFLIAFMGWMPSPLDLSVWMSMWNQAKNQDSGTPISRRMMMTDFNIGYLGTALIAVFFLALGAYVFHGSATALSPNGAAFAGQLIDMYAESIGSWMYPVIGLAALTTMVSTTLTCLDAIPRVMVEGSVMLWPQLNTKSRLAYRIVMLLLIGGALLLLSVFATSMQQMVTLATILSFLTAPVLAIMNYLVVTGKHMPADYKPGRTMTWWSFGGIIFLIAFSIIYLLTL